jgi:hypothetical protein
MKNQSMVIFTPLAGLLTGELPKGVTSLVLRLEKPRVRKAKECLIRGFKTGASSIFNDLGARSAGYALCLLAASACPALSYARSPHGLDDSTTNGPHGYTIVSSGEAFLKDKRPTSEVWQKIWNVCDDKHCDGSFQINYSWAACQLQSLTPALGPSLPGSCSPQDRTVTVRVRGDYSGRNGWETRAAFMDDLFHHHSGDGGVQSNGDAGWPLGLGYPPGWWVAADTYIRRSDGKFWVNIHICPPVCQD